MEVINLEGLEGLEVLVVETVETGDGTEEVPTKQAKAPIAKGREKKWNAQDLRTRTEETKKEWERVNGQERCL